MLASQQLLELAASSQLPLELAASSQPRDSFEDRWNGDFTVVNGVSVCVKFASKSLAPTDSYPYLLWRLHHTVVSDDDSMLLIKV